MRPSTSLQLINDELLHLEKHTQMYGGRTISSSLLLLLLWLLLLFCFVDVVILVINTTVCTDTTGLCQYCWLISVLAFLLLLFCFVVVYQY